METKKEKNLRNMKKHGERLLAIYPNATEQRPVFLYRKLNRIERKLSRLNERACSEFISEAVEDDYAVKELFEKVRLTLGSGPQLELNRDPRGYALKIDDDEVREKKLAIYTDFGGYGIIAPNVQNL